jgi:hypothetical protein
MSKFTELKEFLDSRRDHKTEVVLGIEFLDALIAEVESAGKKLCGVCEKPLGKRYTQVTEKSGNTLFPGRQYPLDVCEVCHKAAAEQHQLDQIVTQSSQSQTQPRRQFAPSRPAPDNG